MPATAAGTLLYRQGAEQLEVLLVHPAGNYNRHKPWSIPKGLPEEGESLEAAARRETREEAGVDAESVHDLGSIQYSTKSRKIVHAFAGIAPRDTVPHCASWEVDRAEFVPLDEARKLLHKDQVPLLDRLLEGIQAGQLPGP